MNPEILSVRHEKLFSARAYRCIYDSDLDEERSSRYYSFSARRNAATKIDRILIFIFRETTTLGVRIQSIERKKLRASTKPVQTSFGTVSAKVINVDGKEQLRVEFEECKRIAVEKIICRLQKCIEIRKGLSS